MKQKIKNIFKQLDLKNHPSTILTGVLEFILLGDIVMALIQKEVSLFSYLCSIFLAMWYAGFENYYYRKYLKEKYEK